MIRQHEPLILTVVGALLLVALTAFTVAQSPAPPKPDAVPSARKHKDHKDADHAKPVGPVAEFGDDLRAELERLRKWEKDHVTFIGEKDHKIAQLKFDLSQLAKADAERAERLRNREREIAQLKLQVRECIMLADRETSRLVRQVEAQSRELATLRKQLAAAQAAPPVAVDGWLESQAYPGVQFYGHQVENGDIVYSAYRFVSRCR